ncbi:RidA family protein [Desulfovibrio sp. OttesenSCG-928-I05]|nr:RidA family protein [Desulfovibrio sp. OttesenSCG-928-I05]
MTHEERLAALGLVLPEIPVSVANYLPYRFAGNLLYLSGQGPVDAAGNYSLGKVGGNVSIEQAYADARLTGINLLAVARKALGSLDRVREVVKVLGMVNAVPEFTQHPAVMNGFSDLMVDVFGEAGRHARSAVGMGSLPNGMTVEVEAILLVE